MRYFADLIEKTVTEKEEKKVQKPPDISKRKFRITKSDDDRMLAFGWASVSMRVDGEIIEDWQQDIAGCGTGICSCRSAGMEPAHGMFSQCGAYGPGSWRAAGQWMGNMAVGECACRGRGSLCVAEPGRGTDRYYTS